MKIKIENTDKTIEFGKKLATFLESGDVVLLDGELGAGKTTLTKGIAETLGITKNIKSPTFTLVREYLDGKIPLYHMDMYRLEHSDPFEVGVDEYLEGDGISIIEWSEFIADILPKDFLKIIITKTMDDEREIEMISSGVHYDKIKNEMSKLYE